MKNLFCLLTAICLASVASALGAEGPAPVEVTKEKKAVAENKAFQVGEKLVYNIYWGLFVVGRASMEVKGIEKIDGHDCYHIVAEARTTGLGRILYTVDSKTESWLDVDELCARKYSEDRTEGKTRHNDEFHYDYGNKKIVVKHRDTGKEESFPLEEPVCDAISLLYAARTLTLNLNESATLTCNDGANNYQVCIKPDEQLQMKAKGVGDAPAVRVEPTPTLKMVAKNGGRMWFWISDDERHLPIIAVSKMKIGSCKLELMEANPPYKKEPLKPGPKTNFGPASQPSP